MGNMGERERENMRCHGVDNMGCCRIENMR